MRLLDSNILIYALQPRHNYLRIFLADKDNAVSIVTKIEVMGFKGLTLDERNYLAIVFDNLNVLSLTSEIAEQATQLKLQKKMSLGDSIIGATVLFYDIELVTPIVRAIFKKKNTLDSLIVKQQLLN
jgi:toxin FitB